MMKAVFLNKRKTMEQKTNELLKRAKEIYGEDVDFLIISHQNERCGGVTHGDSDKIAESIFSAIHTPNNSLGPVLYRILKLVVVNTLKNSSTFTVDLLNTINTTLSEDE